MIKDNVVIWFIGTNSSGKTTQAKLYHNFLNSVYVGFKNLYPKVYEKDDWCFTQMSKVSSNLGRLDSNACSGTDTLNTKERVMKSFKEACARTPIVVVEGIMATGTWIDFMKPPKRNNQVLLVHLDLDLETAILRLRERRSVKRKVRPEEVEIVAKTKDNMENKIKNFKSLKARMADKVDAHITIDQTKTISQTHNLVKDFIYNNIIF